MRRSAIIMVMLTLFCMFSTAQTLPEGVTLLYYGKLQRTGYGTYLESICIYQLNGDHFLHRERGFAGIMSPATSKKDKVAMLPVLTMPLSKSQMQTIRGWLEASQMGQRCESCNQEEDSFRQAGDDPSSTLTPFNSASWKLSMEWPGVFTGLSSEGRYATAIGDSQHPCRDALIHTMSQLHSHIDEIADKYAKKHIDKLWK